MQINSIQNTQNNYRKQPAFNGVPETIGKAVMSKNWLKNVSDHFEFKNSTLSITALMLLLYGATVTPRYIQAKDKYDRREILTRDLISITSILFLANGLSKKVSEMVGKHSGFALVDKPTDFDGHPLKKFWEYISPSGKVNAFTKEEIINKYSNLENYSKGAVGFFEFLHAHSGDAKKVLCHDQEIKQAADQVVGKDINKMSTEEITTAFENVIKLANSKHHTDESKKAEAALEGFYKLLRNPNNALVKMAKLRNSYFGVFFTFLFTPLFIYGIEKLNEHNTKQRVAREKAMHTAQADSFQATKS